MGEAVAVPPVVSNGVQYRDVDISTTPSPAEGCCLMVEGFVNG